MNKPPFIQDDAPMTLERIADACGVSHITVSRALRGMPNVRPATAERIRHYARQMGYHLPARGVRGLVQQYEAGSMPIIVPVEQRTARDPGRRSFFWDYIEGVLEAAAEVREQVEIVDFIAGSDEVAFLRDLLEKRGRVAFLNFRLEGESIRFLYDRGVPLVTRFSQAPDFDLFPGAGIYPDRMMGFRRAWNYLYSKGHRRVGFIAFDEENLRLHECAAAGTFVQPRMTLDRVITLRGAGEGEALQPQIREALSRIPRSDWPTVFMTSNDFLAYHTAVVLRQMGVAVPREVSLFGFDDSSEASLCDPPLTTLRDPRKEVGRAMFHLLKEIIAGNPTARNRIEMLHMPIIERSSVQPLPTL